MTFSSSTEGLHTIAEILSEPQTWRQCLSELLENGQLVKVNEKLNKNVEWIFVGCGSSFYLAQIAASSWSILTGSPARAIPASEILLFPELFPAPCQPVFISRSGRTSEIVEAAQYAESDLGIQSLAITCGMGTPIEEICSQVVRLSSADEKSTVMTRSFTSMLLALQALAAVRASSKSFLTSLQALPTQVALRLDSMQGTVRSLVDKQTYADYVFLGQGPFFGVAQESMLKVKEMSCSYAQAFHTLEFRHGPKAIVSPETLLTFFVSESGFADEISVLREMKELGGTTLVISNSITAAIRASADYSIELSLDVPEVARAVAAVMAGQFLGFYTGMRKGFNPDRPRNLSRVVMLDGRDGGSPRART
ncbi:MAG TPA: SIS domain-containing protein [Candidatus Binatus sp.]|nr:SIS domain-containing protein [Candidatus Binatus sp.]